MEAGKTLHSLMSDVVKLFDRYSRQRIEGIVRIQMLIAGLAMLLGGLISWAIARNMVGRLTHAVSTLKGGRGRSHGRAGGGFA